ncbi:Ataxin-3 [Armadillidium vulgare]|nr:Ataxin-3 [Armadillidium vulgare]
MKTVHNFRLLTWPGYSIFVLDGQLPPCKADDALKVKPAVQTIKPQLLSEVNNEGKLKRKEDEDLKAALRASLHKANSQLGASTSAVLDHSSGASGEDEDLTKAVMMSLESNSFHDEVLDEDDLQKAIRLSLNASSDGDLRKKSDSKCDSGDLETALQMSLDSSLCEVRVPENLLDPDLEEVRRKRLEKLDKK